MRGILPSYVCQFCSRGILSMRNSRFPEGIINHTLVPSRTITGGSCCKGKKGRSGDKTQERNLKAAIESKKKLCLWFLGGPGSGKGTQCNILAPHFNLAHLSTGDLLRNVMLQDTPFANEIRATMERGGLVDTKTVIQLLTNAMNGTYNDSNGYLIDGYPREVAQGELFCQQLGTPHMIIYLHCPDDILTARLLKRGLESGRSDDNSETIKKRLNTFHSISEAVVQRWKEKVVTIDGSVDPLDVENECIRAIEKLEKEHKTTKK